VLDFFVMKKIKKSDLSLNKDVVAILTTSEAIIINGAGVESNNTLCLGCAQATFHTVCLCGGISYYCESELTTMAQVCCSNETLTEACPIEPTTKDCLQTEGCVESVDLCLITTVSCD
jgi:late competence protein required for DNA uptake (superfamily II DNA/RNA helicase)